MPSLRLTRRVRFSAAHRYYRPEWSEERNREVFGACANPHGHGHNYVLEVTVAGEVDPETGFVMDLGQLDAVLREEVVERLDHRHLNHEVERFGEGREIPTTENLAALIWELLEGRLGEGRLAGLRLREDEDLWVEYGGA
jgi:6-pyruvoyltetrahydropterin/6-carboxytetrahydropterin synthase